MNSGALYIYVCIFICMYHLDPKVKPTGEPPDRPSHPDSHACPPALSPARACLLHGPHPASREHPWSRSRPVPTVSPRIPPPQCLHTYHARSIGKHPGLMPHARCRVRSRIPCLRMWLSQFSRFNYALSHICYNGSVIF
jgi:hypothetical protein